MFSSLGVFKFVEQSKIWWVSEIENLIGIHPLANFMTNLPKKMVGTAFSLQKWSYKVWYPLSHLHDPIFPVGFLAIYINEYGHVIHCWEGIE